LALAALPAPRGAENRPPEVAADGHDDRTAAALIEAHTPEVFVWALACAITGAAPAGSDLLYFAFVNCTTLGYGDVTPMQAWRLSGPMTAMNGILMFGSAGARVQFCRSRLASWERSMSTIWR
jgi:ion channel